MKCCLSNSQVLRLHTKSIIGLQDSMVLLQGKVRLLRTPMVKLYNRLICVTEKALNKIRG